MTYYTLVREDTGDWLVRGSLAACIRAAQLIRARDKSIPVRINPGPLSLCS